jgi:UPF0755 protein
MRRLIYLTLSFFIIAGFGCAGSGFWLYSNFTRQGPLKHETVMIVNSGSSVYTIAQQLAANGIITEAFVFRLSVKLFGDPYLMKSGEYMFPAKISSRDIVKLLQTGKTIVHRITFAEGLTSSEIVTQLVRNQNLAGEIPLQIDEGTLLPETYYFSKNDRRVNLIKRMQAGLSEVLEELWENRDVNLPFKSQQEAIILASIVEKETGKSSERAHVAGVFINRLRKGMRLQSDPTVIYGITNGQWILGRPLTRSELRKKTAFNTYTNFGLPQTPIANAGRKSIEAALNPLKTDDLYFVADGRGGHVFARTLRQHNQNVAKWRKLEKLRK